MKLIVGLGNPGEKYASSRHNFGFMVVDKFLKNFSSLSKNNWSNSEKLKSELVVIEWQPKKGKIEKVVLAKPKTYMNNSGMSVGLLSNFYKIDPSDVWIIHDELDLPVGSMKIRFGGAGAGHHGVESVIEVLGTDKFWRFRMGIGVSHAKGEVVGKHKFKDVEDFVLGSFGSEKGKIRELLKHGAQALSHALEKGMESTMNRYNTK